MPLKNFEITSGAPTSDEIIVQPSDLQTRAGKAIAQLEGVSSPDGTVVVEGRLSANQSWVTIASLTAGQITAEFVMCPRFRVKSTDQTQGTWLTAVEF